MENQNEPQKKRDKKLWIVVVALFLVFLIGNISQDKKGFATQSKTEPTEVATRKEPVDEDAVATKSRFECTSDAQRKYKEKWNEKCSSLKKEADCTMPPLEYLPIEKDKAIAMDECFNTYPSKTKFKGEDAFLRELERDKCLNTAEQYYADKWDSQCKRLGRAKNCTLPWASSNPLDEMRRGERDECYSKYPTK